MPNPDKDKKPQGILEVVNAEADTANFAAPADDKTTDKKHSPASSDKTPRKSKFTWTKKKKLILFGILTPFLLILIAIIASIYPLLQIKKEVTNLESSASLAYDSLKHQDLVATKEGLVQTKASLDRINQHYKYLVWYKATPLYWYYNDGQHALNASGSALDAATTLVGSIEPYADVLGFSGEGTFTGGTAEERIVKIISTLDKVTPELDKVASDLQNVQSELEQISPKRYPFTIRGQEVGELLTLAQELSGTAVVAVTDVKPILEVLPSIAGLEEEKKYLVLFQNDAEIRPTGGFMTAYAILRVEKGKVHPENNDDIYALDAKFTKRLPPPEPIEKYLPLVYYWYLRDMNLSPDFKVSMDTFLEHYYSIPSEPDNLDGVIAVDTQVLSDLVAVLGPIDVPGFGTFSSDIDPRCDCPQVIYELEDMATRPVATIRTDRKAFLGPMMQTLILQAYGSPKNVWPSLFETIVNNVVQKHVLFYMFDEQAQAAAEQVNIAGRVRDTSDDYLLAVDANFGGAKSNIFIEEEVELEVLTQEQGTSNTLTVTYKNPAPGSNCNLEAGELCLNGTYRDWVRFYLPQGSTLQEALGFQEDTVETYDELDKTVVEGFFTFQPQSQAKLKLTYNTPITAQDEYKLLIQKQPGKKSPAYTVTVDGLYQEEFDLSTDKELIFELE